MSAKQIFLIAVENYDPNEWDDYLDETCGDDRHLRDRVADLLTAHRQQNPLLDDAGVFSINASNQLIERPGMMIGQFRILEEIGEGGFGVIFLCEQTEPIRRRVAVKVLKPGLDSRQVVARFEAERQALAMMEHPNIASVIEAGMAPSGRPYFAMELVHGIPITEYFDEHQLSVPERLALFLDVCSAVQHAHLKGIIHRDLKPSNILISHVEGKPVVKVIDFGIAKATGNQRLTDKTLITSDFGFVGTPAFMSPEQMARKEIDVDIRSDIYAIGILLYELLTGETPLDAKALQEAGYDELRRMVCECDPMRPSKRIASLAEVRVLIAEQNRKLESGKLRSLLRRELDWIVMKAIEKLPSRRYQSASELADDIRCFLNDAPVRACPPSRIYQLKKFARRHQFALITTGLVATTLVVGSVVSLWQAEQAYSAMRLADLRLENEKLALAKVVNSESELKRQLYASETADALSALFDGDRERAGTLLHRSQPESGKSDFREFAWKFTSAMRNIRPREFVGHDAGILTASLSPDNRWLVSGDRKGTVKVWSVETGREVKSWNYSGKEITTAAFSPDGKNLATAGQDRDIQLWSTSTWKEANALQGHSRTVCSLSWSPDGSRLASGSRDQSVRIWDVASGTESKCLGGMSDVVRKVLWTPAGKHLIASDGNVIRVWDTEDWQQSSEYRQHDQGILALAVSPDGSLVATGGYDSQIVLHNLITNKLMTRVHCGANVWSLTFSPDGKHLVTGLGDGGPILWRIQANGADLEVERGGLELGSIARSIEFTKDQSRLIVASEEDKTIRLWNSKSVFGYEYMSFPEDCMDVVTETDLAICRSSDGSIVLRNFETGEAQNKLVGHKQPVTETAVSSSNRWLATHANENEVLLWDLQSNAISQRFTLVDKLLSTAPIDIQLEFSPDERLIAVAGNFPAQNAIHSARIWNISDGSLLRNLDFDATHHAHIGFHPEGDRIAVGSVGRFATFSLNSQEVQRDSIRTVGHVWRIRYTADGKNLITSGDSLGATVWDAVTSQKKMQFARHRSFVECFSISPDGQTLATAGTEGNVRLWHFPSGQLLGTLMRHTCRLIWIKFASNTKLLVGSKMNNESPQGVFVFDAGE